MAVNTTKSAASIKETAVRDLEVQIKDAAKALNSEKLVKASIPKAFEKNIGPTLPLGINGVQIVLPVDGKEYSVPAPFKTLLNEYIDNLKA